jgi:hypothetical protein
MPPAVPLVEIADDADAVGVRSPDGEAGPLDPVEFAKMGAQSLVVLEMGPFAEQMQVVVAQRGRQRVGIEQLVALATVVDHPKLVQDGFPLREPGFEESLGMQPLHGVFGAAFEHPRLQRTRHEQPHGDSRFAVFLHLVRPQNSKRISLASADDRQHFALGDGSHPFSG